MMNSPAPETFLMRPRPVTFGQKLSRLRNDLRMSAYDFAIHVGITVNQIYHYETDLTVPKFDSLIKIAMACNVSLDYLAGFTEIQGVCPINTNPDFVPLHFRAKHLEVMRSGRQRGENIRRALTVGENNGNAKLSWPIVREIRRKYKAGGTTYLQLSVEYGVSVSSVSAIVRRAVWREDENATQ